MRSGFFAMFGAAGKKGIGHATIPALRSKQVGIAVGDTGTFDPQTKTIKAISGAKGDTSGKGDADGKGDGSAHRLVDTGDHNIIGKLLFGNGK